MEELAHSVDVIIIKDRLPHVVSYDNSKPKGKKINVVDLPKNSDVKAFYDFYNQWDQKSGGLFVPQESILCFVMIIESLFRDKYKMEYKWIGGADPYAAWKKELAENPKGTVY